MDGAAPMSRREEVEKDIVWIESGGLDAECEQWPDLARTLADEVDAERAVVAKLLAMLEPGVAPPKSHVSCDCVECRRHKINEDRYARACEIAGRKE
jgi:hypothetical protein